MCSMPQEDLRAAIAATSSLERDFRFEYQGIVFDRLHPFDVTSPYHIDILKKAQTQGINLIFVTGIDTDREGEMLPEILWTAGVAKEQAEKWREFYDKELNFSRFLDESRKGSLYRRDEIWVKDLVQQKPKRQAVLGFSLDGEPMSIPSGRFFRREGRSLKSEEDTIRNLFLDESSPIFLADDKYSSHSHPKQDVYIQEGKKPEVQAAIEQHYLQQT